MARGSRQTGQQTARINGGGTEILQLREYRRGDPLRIVDWKASARRGRPISRDMTEDQHLEIMVAIDAGRASGLAAGEVDRLSLYVNVAARLAQRAAALDDAVGLLVFAAQPLVALTPARGDIAVARIRKALVACRVQPGEANAVLAAARLRALSHRRSLIILLTDLEDASATEQLVQAVSLLSPKHFVLIAGFESARIGHSPQPRPASHWGPTGRWPRSNTATRSRGTSGRCEPSALRRSLPVPSTSMRRFSTLIASIADGEGYKAGSGRRRRQRSIVSSRRRSMALTTASVRVRAPSLRNTDSM
jgi:uncharacterized protein (DUF58 family)